jgi:hypothetical protein
LDFTGLAVSDETSANGNSKEDAISAEINPVRGVFKLNVTTDDTSDLIVSGDGSFLRFDDKGLFITPEDIKFEFNWASSQTFAPNTHLSLNLREAGNASGLSVGSENFVLSDILQNGVVGGEIDYGLFQPGGDHETVLDTGEERQFSVVAHSDIRSLGIPVHRASYKQPQLSTPRETPVEEGATEHLQYSE